MLGPRINPDISTIKYILDNFGNVIESKYWTDIVEETIEEVIPTE